MAETTTIEKAPLDYTTMGNVEAPVETSEQPATTVEEKAVETTETKETQAPADVLSDKFDPQSLPKELQPAYREMRKTFTQKTQGLAEERKAAQAMVEKARTLDTLLANPQFQTWLQSPPANGNNAQDEQERIAQMSEEDKIQFYMQKAEERMERKLQETLRPMQQSEDRRRADKEIDDCEEKFSDFWDHYPEISQLVDQPRYQGYALEDLYYKVTAPKARALGKQDVMTNMQQKKGVNTIRPTSTTSVKPVREARSIQEAYRLAKERGSE